MSVQIDTVRVTLPLRHKFVISQGEAESKTNLLVILNNRYTGEAASSIYYGPSVDEIESEIKRALDILGNRKEYTESILDEISELPINPVAKSALTAMFLNFLSGETNKYPWEVLGVGSPVGIRNSITISVAPAETVIRQITDSEAPIIKLKMGADDDIEVAKALKEIDNKELRVDANGAWDCEKAAEVLYYLAEAGVQVVEQPTSNEEIKEWPYLKKDVPEVELIVDEGLATLEDYERFAEYCDGVNIKMVKSGGAVAALRIAEKARSDKRKVMLGCMVESSVGIAQSIYISAMGDYYDLDGPSLLSEDIASGIVYDNESIEVDREIIGGPKLKREVVEKYIDA